MKKIFIICIIGFVLTFLTVIYVKDYFKDILVGYDYYSLIIMIVNCLLSLWLIIPVIVLLIDKYNDNRPKLIISFEIIRSSLVCLVIRNIGNTELELISLKMNDDFITQLDSIQQTALKSMDKTKIFISSKKQWVLNLGITTFNLLEKFKTKELEIKYKYRKPGRMKTFCDKVKIDFNSYAHFMIYISELDEINTSIKKLTSAVEKKNNKIEGQLVETTRLISQWVERQKL